MPESIHPESIPLSFSLSSPPDQVALELASIVEFMRTDPDNLVFRRFEKLNIYNLLRLQHRLAVCEEEISTHEQRWDGVALAESLPKLEALMKSYNEAFVAQVTMRKLHSTPQHLASTLRAHAKSCLKPLQHELNSPEGWSDLFSLASNEKGWIQTFIDRHYHLSRLFRKAGTEDSKSGLFIYSERGVRIAEQTIVYTASCILVLAPIIALSFITTRIGKLSLVLACVLLASFVSSVLTDSAQKSNLALVAGYTAILVVFLSNSDGNEK